MKTRTKKHQSVINLLVLSLVLILASSCGLKSNSKSTVPEMDIHAAALTGNLEAINQHIVAGTDLNGKDPIGGSTPLITASVFGKTDVALRLIEAGVDLNQQNNDGSTALHCAALFCNKDIVEALLLNGADKSIPNKEGGLAIQAVEGSFEDWIPVYDFFSKELGPLGLKLDYKQLEKTRPVIQKMLK